MCDLGCFFFNETATTEIYTLSLHDALPISLKEVVVTYPVLLDPGARVDQDRRRVGNYGVERADARARSEEHTSELQSRSDIACRLLLEKKIMLALYTCSKASSQLSTNVHTS